MRETAYACVACGAWCRKSSPWSGDFLAEHRLCEGVDKVKEWPSRVFFQPGTWYLHRFQEQYNAMEMLAKSGKEAQDG